jgi:hypothetical protein
MGKRNACQSDNFLMFNNLCIFGDTPFFPFPEFLSKIGPQGFFGLFGPILATFATI